MKRVFLLMVFIFLGLALTAADTTEPFEKGASDFEMYFDFSGIGAEKYNRTMAAEGVIGFGLTDYISATFAAGAESNEFLANSAAGFGFGLFATLLDSDHFDFDFYFGFDSDMVLTPGVEINFDVKPDLELAGGYLRVKEGFSGRVKNAAGTEYELVPQSAVTVGGYYTLNEKMMIHAEFDFALNHNPDTGERDTDIGGAALGFNVVIHENIEIINQVYADIPQDEEDFTVGVGTGIIVTLPIRK